MTKKKPNAKVGRPQEEGAIRRTFVKKTCYIPPEIEKAVQQEIKGTKESFSSIVLQELKERYGIKDAEDNIPD